jgi:GNAT superfamily N-acetyltransferase
VGWIGVGVRTALPRLVNSRTIPAIDDLPVWSIGCFRIRRGYRRRGIGKALLAAMIEAAKGAGAPGVGGLPDLSGGRPSRRWRRLRGIASIFDAAGFRRVLVTDGHSGHLLRILMRLDLTG